MKPDDHEADFEASLLARSDVRLHDDGDGTYLYRPREILVDEAEVERLGDLLGPCGAHRMTDEYTDKLGIWRFATAEDVDIPALVAEAEEIAPGALSPNHVLLGSPHRFGGPAGPASVAPPLEPTAIGSEVGAGISIAVLDTGIWSEAPLHTISLPEDEDVLDSEPDLALDQEAAHGGFIAGILSRLAPGAGIHAIRVLNTAGVGCDTDIAAGLLRAPAAEIINLSLGGPTLGATGVPVLERAIDALDRSTVVVAAAGNAGRRIPFFPAAFKRVISVGAIQRDTKGKEWLRAPFSNHGWWVDACAPGVDVHSIFPEYVEQSSMLRDFSSGSATWDGTSFAAPQLAACIAAVATRDSISAQDAAWRLVHDPARRRLTGLGAIVDPEHLP